MPLQRPLPAWAVDAELARKGRFYERNQYLLGCGYRAVHDSAAPLEAQAETTDRRISITKDVPLLRIDHLSTESSLPGVRRRQHPKAVTVTATK